MRIKIFSLCFFVVTISLCSTTYEFWHSEHNCAVCFASNATTYKLIHPQYNKAYPGLFSVFFTVLGVLDFYEKSPNCSGLLVDFGSEGLYYDANYGPNWWEYYFEPIRLGMLEGDDQTFQNFNSSFCLFAAYKMSCERGYELIQKYIKPKQHLQEKIDFFVKEYFEDNYVIGIHYRGTDKMICEAPFVNHHIIVNRIKSEINNLLINGFADQKIKIFIATDEERFLQLMYQNFPEKIVVIDALRSFDGRSIHNSSSQDGYKRGEEAVMGCILLSKCKKLYRTSSNLSAASTRFNPSIEVILLNKNEHERSMN